MDKLLTVAIPAYNRSETLKCALDVIANQYDERVEVLICDDSTNEDVQKMIEEMRERIPIRYIKNNINLGFDKNFLQCFKEANGKYVLLMGDDDILIDLSHIVEYLTQNKKVDWVFVNYCSFLDDWVNVEKSSLYTLKNIDDKVEVSKKEFMDYAGFSITCDTTILCKDKIANMDDLYKFVGTFFIQTCVPLEITKSKDSILGIIGKPCVALRATQEGQHLYEDSKAYFQAYAIGIRKVLCDIAPKCGYDKRQMRKLFKKSIVVMAHPIAYMKTKNMKDWEESFWQYCYPAIRDFAISWLVIMPIIIAPRWFARFLLEKIYPFCHKNAIKRARKLADRID